MWDSRRWLWHFSTVNGVRGCSRGMSGEVVEVRSAERGHLQLRGVYACSSVWFCPACARRVTRGRHELLVHALASWEGASFGTLTLAERRGETLEARVKRLAATWRAAVKHMGRDYDSHWRYVRVMECARGSRDQGHPHFHVIVKESAGSTMVGEELLRRWLAAAGDSRRSAQDVRQGDTADALHYLTKEALGSSGKRSSHWSMLYEAMDGTPGSLVRWHRMEKALKGARQIVVSRGLYKEAGLVDVADADMPEEQRETWLLDLVAKCAWRRLVASSGLIAEITQAWEDWDSERVDELLASAKCRRYRSGIHGLHCKCDDDQTGLV